MVVIFPMKPEYIVGGPYPVTDVGVVVTDDTGEASTSVILLFKDAFSEALTSVREDVA